MRSESIESTSEILEAASRERCPECGGSKVLVVISWDVNLTMDTSQSLPCTACVVLDPFAGTATTLIAAQRLGRKGIGCDISDDYLQQAVKRLSGLTLPMVGL